MKEVFIDGEIGYDWWSDSGVTAKSVQKQLEGLNDDEEINVIINSPGGSVYEGIVIFNIIRDHAKTHPVSTRVIGIAMSAASYIALAARTVNKKAKISVSGNSIMMIHNPWGVTWGDYRDMKKTGDYFEKVAALYASTYAVVTGKTEKEMRDAMDEETYYVGEEIIDIGIANDFEKIEPEEENVVAASARSGGRDALIAKARFEMERTQEKAREAKTKNAAAYRGDFEKAVALFTNIAPKPPAAEHIHTGGNNNSGGRMTIEELKAQNKSVYDEIFSLGETSGVDKERARVNAHLLLGEKSGSLIIAAKHIKAGVSTADETVQAEYFAAKMDSVHIDARNEDDVGDINAGGKDGNADDDAKMNAAFDNGLMGRDARGKPCQD